MSKDMLYQNPTTRSLELDQVTCRLYNLWSRKYIYLLQYLWIYHIVVSSH